MLSEFSTLSKDKISAVLILVLMEDALGVHFIQPEVAHDTVLILVLLEDALGEENKDKFKCLDFSS